MYEGITDVALEDQTLFTFKRNYVFIGVRCRILSQNDRTKEFSIYLCTNIKFLREFAFFL